MHLYVLLKIIKYCTGSSARSYQCKYAVNDALRNRDIKSMEEVGAAIKKIIHYNTIRGKFSSVHPDLAAEGITRVGVGEEGVRFIADSRFGWLSVKLNDQYSLFWFQMSAIRGWH